MKNIGLKRILSALLTLCVVFSMLTIAVASASGSLTLKADSSLSLETVNDVNLLKGVKERQTVASVLADFESSAGITVTKDGVVLADDDFVGTGTIISTESVSASVVVLGDIDGDGIVSITDYMQIKSALINNTALDAISLLAADTSADGKIDTVDYAQVKSYFLGLYNLYPEVNDDTSDSSEDESADSSIEESSEEVSTDSSIEESSEEVSTDSSIEESSEEVSADSSIEESSEEVSADSSIEESSEEVSYTYILNVKSKKIHLATCSGAATISEKNRQGYNGDIADLIAEGYTTCGTCKPDQYEEPSEAPSEESSEVPSEAPSVDSSDDSSVDSSTDSSETPSEEPSEEEVSYTYILNTKSKKIHLATCSGAATISEKNRQGYNGDIADLIAEGYTTCGTCKPDQE